MRGQLKALRMVERYAAVSPAHRTRAMAFYVTAGVQAPARHVTRSFTVTAQPNSKANKRKDDQTNGDYIVRP